MLSIKNVHNKKGVKNKIPCQMKTQHYKRGAILKMATYAQNKMAAYRRILCMVNADEE